jgi:hypothetical protein
MKAITVRFPAPLPAEIPCPVCFEEDLEVKRGNGCVACEFSGKIHITVDAKIPIQRTHIIKYIADNMSAVSSELTRVFGLVPEVETQDVLEMQNAQYEIVQVSSLGGAVWIANRLDAFEAPKYFYSTNELRTWKTGVELDYNE